MTSTPPETAPLLQFEDVRAGYTACVVGPVSLTVHAGEIVGLSGVNGAGKTTLLKVVTGGARLISGSIARAPALTIAHHRQHPERPPELPLTGAEVLRLAGVADCALPERIAMLRTRCLDEMSGGEYQLLQAWGCLMGPSRLVILDEPTNNLDQHAIELLLRELRRLAGDRAVLLVSHEQPFLNAACSRLVTLP